MSGALSRIILRSPLRRAYARPLARRSRPRTLNPWERASFHFFPLTPALSPEGRSTGATVPTSNSQSLGTGEFSFFSPHPRPLPRGRGSYRAHGFKPSPLPACAKPLRRRQGGEGWVRGGESFSVASARGDFPGTSRTIIERSASLRSATGATVPTSNSQSLGTGEFSFFFPQPRPLPRGRGSFLHDVTLYQRSLIRTHAPICACRGT